MFDVYCWLEDKFVEEDDEIDLWETQLPLYIFPKTHSFPKFIRKFQTYYDINQRTVVTPIGEILFAINAQSIQKMM